MALVLSLSFSDKGLYKEDCITAPTPISSNAIIDKNCDIDETKPFIVEPKEARINLGRINPHTTVVNWSNSEDIVFNLNLVSRLIVSIFLYSPLRFQRFRNNTINLNLN